MRIAQITSHLRGLRTQALPWTVLPLTLLLIIFCLSGISSHQQSMHSLAAEENIRLVCVLARLISARVENHTLQSQTPDEEVPSNH